jgi:hypothetical protein
MYSGPGYPVIISHFSCQGGEDIPLQNRVPDSGKASIEFQSIRRLKSKFKKGMTKYTVYYLQGNKIEIQSVQQNLVKRHESYLFFPIF